MVSAFNTIVHTDFPSTCHRQCGDSNNLQNLCRPYVAQNIKKPGNEVPFPDALIPGNEVPDALPVDIKPTDRIPPELSLRRSNKKNVLTFINLSNPDVEPQTLGRIPVNTAVSMNTQSGVNTGMTYGGATQWGTVGLNISSQNEVACDTTNNGWCYDTTKNDGVCCKDWVDSTDDLICGQLTNSSCLIIHL